VDISSKSGLLKGIASFIREKIAMGDTINQELCRFIDHNK